MTIAQLVYVHVGPASLAGYDGLDVGGVNQWTC